MPHQVLYQPELRDCNGRGFRQAEGDGGRDEGEKEEERLEGVLSDASNPWTAVVEVESACLAIFAVSSLWGQEGPVATVLVAACESTSGIRTLVRLGPI